MFSKFMQVIARLLKMYNHNMCPVSGTHVANFHRWGVSGVPHTCKYIKSDQNVWSLQIKNRLTRKVVGQLL